MTKQQNDTNTFATDFGAACAKETGAKSRFGSETLLANGTKAANGFEALRQLDSNQDGKVDTSDTDFASLRVWKDANGNGLTDSGELIALADAGVQSINVAYTSSTAVDAQGNEHRQVSSFTTTGATRSADDVWFKVDRTYAIATDVLAVPDDIAALPDASRYGKVRDLRQTMVRDSTGALKTKADAIHLIAVNACYSEGMGRFSCENQCQTPKRQIPRCDSRGSSPKDTYARSARPARHKGLGRRVKWARIASEPLIPFSMPTGSSQ